MSNMPVHYTHPADAAAAHAHAHAHAHHHAGQTPAMWNKTPFGFGDAAAAPFVNPATGFDMSRALANPASFFDNSFGRQLANPVDMDRTVRSMEHAMQREMMGMQRDMQRMLQNVDRDFNSSLVHHPARPASVMEHYSLMNPIRIDHEGNRWLNCCFDLRSFKPEEVSVTLNSKERCINVEANHEVKDSKDHYIKRHYARKFFLPETINADLSKLELKSCLTNDGLLCIESALPKISPADASKMSITTPGAFATVPINVKHI